MKKSNCQKNKTFKFEPLNGSTSSFLSLCVYACVSLKKTDKQMNTVQKNEGEHLNTSQYNTH